MEHREQSDASAPDGNRPPTIGSRSASPASGTLPRATVPCRGWVTTRHPLSWVPHPGSDRLLFHFGFDHADRVPMPGPSVRITRNRGFCYPISRLSLLPWSSPTLLLDLSLSRTPRPLPLPPGSVTYPRLWGGVFCRFRLLRRGVPFQWRSLHGTLPKTLPSPFPQLLQGGAPARLLVMPSRTQVRLFFRIPPWNRNH